MWKQLVTPNLDPYVYDPGLLSDWFGECLATVRAAFNAPYSGWCAWVGWTYYVQVQHEDRNFPIGVYFPIWFSGYGGEGHVAFAYVNSSGAMGIWTSPYTHVPYFFTGYHSVDELAAGYGVTYVGWSEDIAGMNVIQQVADAPPPTRYSVVETYTDKMVKLNKQPTYLWGMNWDFTYMVANPIETHNAGETWPIADKVHHEDGMDYYRRPGQVDGFNVLDCDDYTPPVQTPSPTPEPLPVPIPTPTPPAPVVDPPVPTASTGAPGDVITVTVNPPAKPVPTPSAPKTNWFANFLAAIKMFFTRRKK